METLGKLVQHTTNVKVSINSIDMSDNEFEAVSRGVKKSSLSGNYTVNNEDVTFTADEKIALNQFYGKLNDKSLTALYKGKKRVQMEDGTYKEIAYKSMTDKQKKAAIESTLSTNSQYSKIYILTSTGKYKYYASDSEYEELRKLGITKNVYRSVGTSKGFVKI